MMMTVVSSANYPMPWGYSSFSPAANPYGYYQNPYWISPAYSHNPYPIANDNADKYPFYNPVESIPEVILNDINMNYFGPSKLTISMFIYSHRMH